MAFPEDKIITERISRGDPHAENELFLHYRARIEFLVRIRLRGKVSLDDQKDMISEIQTAMLVSLRRGGFDPSRGKSLDAYIAGIASNIIGQHFRRLKKEKTVTSDTLDEISLNPGSALSEMMTRERTEKLKRCLSRLKPRYKKVLLLRIYEKKSIPEIGKELKIAPRRVSERIHYALKLMFKECQKENYFQYYDDSLK